MVTHHVPPSIPSSHKHTVFTAVKKKILDKLTYTSNYISSIVFWSMLVQTNKIHTTVEWTSCDSFGKKSYFRCWVVKQCIIPFTAIQQCTGNTPQYISGAVKWFFFGNGARSNVITNTVLSNPELSTHKTDKVWLYFLKPTCNWCLDSCDQWIALRTP